MSDLLQFVREAWSLVWVQALVAILTALLVGKIVDVVLCRGLKVLTRRTKSDVDDRIIEQLHRPIFVSVVLFGLYVALTILVLPQPFHRITVAIVQTVALVMWLGAGLRIVTTLLDGLGQLADKVSWIEARTVPLFDNLFKIVFFGGVVYMLLKVWGQDVRPWLTSAGIAGLAIGFAAKDTLANVFSGLFIIIDAPYTLGDFINLGSGERGQVTKIGLRSSRILTRDDIEITVPNAVIGNSMIINESGGRWVKTRISVEVGVAYGSDVDHVREVLARAAASVEHVLSDPEPRIRFNLMGDSALTFRVLCWIREPVFRGETIDGLNTAIYKALNAEGISIPFPQRDVHLYPAGSPASS